MTDLDSMVEQVWSPEVRPLAREALRCYYAGALRASIAATWTAVTADIIAKLTTLASDGEAQAASFRASVVAAQDKGLSSEGVRAMQAIEAALLAEAEKCELVDAIGGRELARIREDRHLCVHPSLRAFGEVYTPLPDTARGHLAVALNTLLIHPPTQGSALVNEFISYVSDPLFVASMPHLQAAFHDRARPAARRNIVTLAAKHALLELDPGPALGAVVVAERMTAALSAFALRDRELVGAAVAAQRDRFQRLEGMMQLRALIRLGTQDYFWDNIDEPLADRLQGLLRNLPTPQTWDVLAPADAAAYALVRSELARKRLPELEARFNALPVASQMSVIATQPDPYYLPVLVQGLRDAGSFRVGEQVGQMVLAHASYLTNEMLREALEAWSDNNQCRRAAQMPSVAIDLLHATAHLGAAREPVFTAFLTSVCAQETDDPYYRYPDLERALNKSVLL